jgi:PIN domain
MAFTVLYDTCALYPNTQRNLLIRLARTGLVRARWSAGILAELDRALAERPVARDKRRRLFELMNAAVPDCPVEGYEPLIDGLKLPDLDDRHVLAAAIKVGAQLIVTNNLADFPEDALASWNCWPHGTCMREAPTTSSLISSASTGGWSTRASSRSSTSGAIRPSRSLTFLVSWSAQV